MMNKISLESGFIGRVYRTSVVVYAIVSLYVLAYVGVPGWLGLTAGVGLGLLSLRSIEWSAQRFLAPRDASARRSFPWWGVAIGKYLAFAVIVAVIVRAAQAQQLNLFAFLGGFALVHAVIVLKALGATWLGLDRPRSIGPTPGQPAAGSEHPARGERVDQHAR
jgi:hypothetical protein